MASFVSTDAPIAPEAGYTHKKIQLCVCFPTDSTQQLSLIYKEKKDSDSINIVSLITPKNEFDKALGFESLNRLYNYLSAIEGVSGFKIEKSNETIKVIVDEESIIEGILKTLDINNIKNLEDFNETISILIENIKNPKDPNDLETNGGYFDKGRIIYRIQDRKFNSEKYTIEKIVDVNTIEIKPDDGNHITVDLSEIYFDNKDIVQSKYSFELLNIANVDNNKNIVLYRSNSAINPTWFLGKLTGISNTTNTTNTTYIIETFENKRVEISDRSSIRYVQTDETGKILTSAEVQAQRSSKGGNPIHTTQKSSNTTTKKQRHQRKRTGKTRRKKPA